MGRLGNPITIQAKIFAIDMERSRDFVVARSMQISSLRNSSLPIVDRSTKYNKESINLERALSNVGGSVAKET